jgi:hypothetical protein
MLQLSEGESRQELTLGGRIIRRVHVLRGRADRTYVGRVLVKWVGTMTTASVGTAASGGAAVAAATALQAQAKPAATTTSAEDSVAISATAQEVQQPTAVQVRLLRNEGQSVQQIATKLQTTQGAVQSYLGKPASAPTPKSSFARYEAPFSFTSRVSREALVDKPCSAAFSASSVDPIFFRRRGIVLFVQFVLCFQPVFQRVSAVNPAVALMNLVRSPLDFVQAMSGFVFRTVLGLARGKSELEDVANYNLVCFLHIGPSFCTAQPISGYNHRTKHMTARLRNVAHSTGA